MRSKIQSNVQSKHFLEEFLGEKLFSEESRITFLRHTEFKKYLSEVLARPLTELDLRENETFLGAMEKSGLGSLMTEKEANKRISFFQKAWGGVWAEAKDTFEYEFLTLASKIAKEFGKIRLKRDPARTIPRHQWLLLFNAFLQFYAGFLQRYSDQALTTPLVDKKVDDVRSGFIDCLAVHFPASGEDTKTTVSFWNDYFSADLEKDAVSEKTQVSWNTKESLADEAAAGELRALKIERDRAAEAERVEAQRLAQAVAAEKERVEKEAAEATENARKAADRAAREEEIKHSPQALLTLISQSATSAQTIFGLQTQFIKRDTSGNPIRTLLVDRDIFSEKFKALSLPEQKKVWLHLSRAEKLLTLAPAMEGKDELENFCGFLAGEMAALLNYLETEASCAPADFEDPVFESLEAFYQAEGVPDSASDCEKYFVHSLKSDLPLQMAVLGDLKLGKNAGEGPIFEKAFRDKLNSAVQFFKELKSKYNTLSRNECMALFSSFLNIYAASIDNEAIREIFLNKVRDQLPSHGKDNLYSISIWPEISPECELEKGVASFKKFYPEGRAELENCAWYLEVLAGSFPWNKELFAAAFVYREKPGAFEAAFHKILVAAAKKFKTFKQDFEAGTENRPLRDKWMQAFRFCLQAYGNSLDNEGLKQIFSEMLDKYIPSNGIDTEYTKEISGILFGKQDFVWADAQELKARETRISKLIEILRGPNNAAPKALYEEFFSALQDDVGRMRFAVDPFFSLENFATVFKASEDQGALLSNLIYARENIKKPVRGQVDYFGGRNQLIQKLSGLINHLLLLGYITEEQIKEVQIKKDETPKQRRLTNPGSSQKPSAKTSGKKNKKQPVLIEGAPVTKNNNHPDQGGAGGSPESSSAASISSSTPAVTASTETSSQSSNSTQATSTPLGMNKATISRGNSRPASPFTLTSTPRSAELAAVGGSSKFQRHFDEFAIGLIMSHPFPSDKSPEIQNLRFFDSFIIAKLTDSSSLNYLEQAQKQSWKIFSGIFDNAHGLNINKVSLTEKFNQFLNEKWDEFAIIWAQYSQKMNPQSEHVLEPISMKRLFLSYIFEAMPVLVEEAEAKIIQATLDDETASEEQKKKAEARRSLSGLHSKLHYLLVSDESILNSEFPNGATFKRWKPDFKCTFNENFELEKISFSEVPLVIEAPVEKQDILAQEETFLLPEDFALPPTPVFTHASIHETITPHFDEFAIQTILQKDIGHFSRENGREEFFDIQKDLEAHALGEFELSAINSRKQLSDSQNKFVNRFKAFTEEKYSKKAFKAELTKLLNENWKPFLELIVKYRAEKGVFSLTPQNVAKLFGAYLLPLTSFSMGAESAEHAEMREKVKTRVFTDVLTDALAKTWIPFESVRDLCENNVKFNVVGTRLFAHIEIESSACPSFVEYREPKMDSFEVTEDAPDHAYEIVDVPLFVRARGTVLPAETDESAFSIPAVSDKGKAEAEEDAAPAVEKVFPDPEQSFEDYLKEFLTPEERTLELINFLNSEEPKYSDYVLLLPAEPRFRMPNAACFGFCPETFQQEYPNIDDPAVKNLALRRLLEIKMAFDLKASELSPSQERFLFELNELISVFEKDKKKIEAIHSEVLRYLTIQRKCLSLIYAGNEALKNKMPKWQSVSLAPPSEMRADDTMSLNTDEPEKPQAVPQDQVEMLQIQEEINQYNAALKDVSYQSSCLVAEHFANVSTEQELKEARASFAKTVRPKFEKLVDAHPVLKQYEGFKEMFWTGLLNVAMCIVLPWLIIRVAYQSSKKSPVFYHSARAEAVYKTLQKSVVRDVENVGKCLEVRDQQIARQDAIVKHKLSAFYSNFAQEETGAEDKQSKIPSA